MNETDEDPSEEEVKEYALWLGMDVEKDADLLWIAKEGLKAPVPEKWLPCKNDTTGEIYFLHTETGEKSWDHPCDKHFKELFLNEKTRKEQEKQERENKEAQEKILVQEKLENADEGSSQTMNTTEPINQGRLELFKEMLKSLLGDNPSEEKRVEVFQKLMGGGKLDSSLMAAVEEVKKEFETDSFPEKDEDLRNENGSQVNHSQERESPDSTQDLISEKMEAESKLQHAEQHSQGDVNPHKENEAEFKSAQWKKKEMYMEMASAWIQCPDLGENKIIEKLCLIPVDAVYASALQNMAIENDLHGVAVFLRNKFAGDIPPRLPKQHSSLTVNDDPDWNLPANCENQHITEQTDEPLLTQAQAATLIQAMIRGVLARSYVLEVLYWRAWRALTQIQALARGWLVRKALWSKNQSSRLKWVTPPQAKGHDRESWLQTWQRIVDKTPSYIDKVRFWQTVIDIKRVAPDSANVEVMAALFECEGTIQRAITLLSSEEHMWRLRRSLKGLQIPNYLLPVQKLPPRAQRLRRRRSQNEMKKTRHRTKDIFPLIESIFMGEVTKPAKLKAVSKSPKKGKTAKILDYAKRIGQPQSHSSSSGEDST